MKRINTKTQRREDTKRAFTGMDRMDRIGKASAAGKGCTVSLVAGRPILCILSIPVNCRGATVFVRW